MPRGGCTHPKPITVNGVTYPRQLDLAKAINRSTCIVSKRIRQGRIEELIERANLDIVGPSKPCIFAGKRYNSITEASIANHIPYWLARQVVERIEE